MHYDVSVAWILGACIVAIASFVHGLAGFGIGLVSLAFRLGSEWKLRAPWNKYVLRESMRGRIPEKVRVQLRDEGEA